MFEQVMTGAVQFHRTELAAAQPTPWSQTSRLVSTRPPPSTVTLS